MLRPHSLSYIKTLPALILGAFRYFYKIYRYPLQLSPFSLFASSTVANLPLSLVNLSTVSGSPASIQSVFGPEVTTGGRTVVVDTIDYFFSHSLIPSGVFGPQCEVVNRRSQHS